MPFGRTLREIIPNRLACQAFRTSPGILHIGEISERSRSSFDDVFRDYQSHYFRGSFADRVEPRISPVPVHIEFIRIPIASVYLNRLIADPQSMLASEDLGLGRFRFERFALVLQVRGSVDHHPRRVDIRQHVSELRLYHLKVRERFTESGPDLAVLDSLVKSSPSNPSRNSSDSYSSAKQHLLRILETLTLSADEALLWNVSILKDNLRSNRASVAQLVDVLTRFRRFCVDEEC